MNTARKILILVINVFLSRYSVFYRLLSVMLLLLAFYRLQLKIQPYKNKLNNRLERTEAIAGAFTLYGGTLFVNEDNEVAVFNSIIFILIIIAN